MCLIIFFIFFNFDANFVVIRIIDFFDFNVGILWIFGYFELALTLGLLFLLWLALNFSENFEDSFGLIPFLKLFVIKVVLILKMPLLVKAIHIQLNRLKKYLPNKRSVFFMFEVLRQDL